jgi:hypothetical protein
MSRRGARKGLSANLFASTGWLFADLFIALAMVFLVANTVATIPPPVVERAPAPTPILTPTPIPPRALDLNPVSITLTVNVSALLAGNSTEVASIQRQVRAVPQLRGRSAGLALTFGGAQGGNTSKALQIAAKIDTAVLSALGAQGFDFQNTVYREFINLSNPPDTVQIDIYVFKQ